MAAYLLPYLLCFLNLFIFSSPLFAALPQSSVFQSTSSPAYTPSAMPGMLNATGAFKGVMPPKGLQAYNWQAGVLSFSDTFSGMPLLFVSASSGKNGFLLLGGYSRSYPHIKDEAAFLRKAGVPVKKVYTNVPIVGGGTATYTTDLVRKFETGTGILEAFYSRQVYANEFVQTTLLAGMPFVLNSYSVSATLDDGSEFNQRRLYLGSGVSAGITASFSSSSILNKGLTGGLYLIYNKLWFPHSDELSRAFQFELNGFRFGFSLGWRFSFY